MDPNCAICDGPGYKNCQCEHQSLIVAVEQSEHRILNPMWDQIRYWVTTQAKAEIHRDFAGRTSRRRAYHSQYLSDLNHSGRYTSDVLDQANLNLKRGVDEDWRASVQRYPEVLDYFYSLITWSVRDGYSAIPQAQSLPHTAHGHLQTHTHTHASTYTHPSTVPIVVSPPLGNTPSPPSSETVSTARGVVDHHQSRNYYPETGARGGHLTTHAHDSTSHSRGDRTDRDRDRERERERERSYTSRNHSQHSQRSHRSQRSQHSHYSHGGYGGYLG